MNKFQMFFEFFMHILLYKKNLIKIGKQIKNPMILTTVHTVLSAQMYKTHFFKISSISSFHMVYNISLQNTSILYLFSRVLKHAFKFCFIIVLHLHFYITSRIFFHSLTSFQRQARMLHQARSFSGKKEKVSFYLDYSTMHCHAKTAA